MSQTDKVTSSRGSLQRLAVFASLALVVLAATAALIMMQGIDRQLRDVIDTYEVRNQARELTNALA
ncbi:MAG: histidine kinase, partial [Devosia sp.]|nr:histidine kinase [Devosia sp.]